MAAAVRPERNYCGDDLGGDARKFGDEYGGESREVGAFVAGVAAGSGDRVDVRGKICSLKHAGGVFWEFGAGTEEQVCAASELVLDLIERLHARWPPGVELFNLNVPLKAGRSARIVPTCVETRVRYASLFECKGEAGSCSCAAG